MKIDYWLILGFVGQGIFFLRFVIQWVASEREGRSIIPLAFWYCSILGATLLFVYALHRRDPVFYIGTALSLVIYFRNLVLIRREKS